MSDARYHKPSSTGALVEDALIVSCSSLARGRPATIAVLGLTCVVMLTGCTTRASAPPPAPATVEVVTVVEHDTPIYSEWVAALDGYVNAQIQPRVSGYLIKQNYREGLWSSQGRRALSRSIRGRSRPRSIRRRRSWRRRRHSLARPASMSSATRR